MNLRSNGKFDWKNNKISYTKEDNELFKSGLFQEQPWHKTVVIITIFLTLIILMTT